MKTPFLGSCPDSVARKTFSSFSSCERVSKRVSIATPELRSFGALEMSYVNGRGFNFDVAPSLVGIWCPLIYEVGDVGDVGGSE